MQTMEFSKRHYSVKATSLLESVIALSIISICLYFAILIFSMVFTPKTSVKFYDTQNKINELFYLSALKSDSLSESANDVFSIEENRLSTGLKQVKVSYKDSARFQFRKSFYLQIDE